MENKMTVIPAPEFIAVDTGYEEIEIKDLRGNVIGRMYIQPADFDIINRYDDMIEHFADIIEPLNQVKRTEGMSDDDYFDVQWEAMEEARQRLYAAFDKAFGGNFSQAFFGQVHPFSPVKGRFYCERVLEAAGKYLAARFQRETKKLSTKTEQYIHGYRSGKHRNGNRNRGGKR